MATDDLIPFNAPASGPTPHSFLEMLRLIVLALNAQVQRMGPGTVLPVVYAAPTNGATLTSPTGIGGYELDPAAGLATTNIVLPPAPADQQVFTISSTETIMTLTVTGAGGATVKGGVLTLAGNGGIAFRYRSGDATWRRIY